MKETIYTCDSCGGTSKQHMHTFLKNPRDRITIDLCDICNEVYQKKLSVIIAKYEAEKLELYERFDSRGN